MIFTFRGVYRWMEICCYCLHDLLQAPPAHLSTAASFKAPLTLLSTNAFSPIHTQHTKTIISRSSILKPVAVCFPGTRIASRMVPALVRYPVGSALALDRPTRTRPTAVPRGPAPRSWLALAPTSPPLRHRPSLQSLACYQSG